MLIDVDARITINTDVPILSLTSATSFDNEPVTVIRWAIPQLPPTVVHTDRQTLAAVLEDVNRLVEVPTEVPVQGSEETSLDFLNRITPPQEGDNS